MQALHKMALAPVAETTADLSSYGFRESRGCADAVACGFNALARPNSAPWILEADITGCYDNISQEWMLKNIPSKTVKFFASGSGQGTLKTADCTLREKELRKVGLFLPRSRTGR